MFVLNLLLAINHVALNNQGIGEQAAPLTRSPFKTGSHAVITQTGTMIFKDLNHSDGTAKSIKAGKHIVILSVVKDAEGSSWVSISTEYYMAKPPSSGWVSAKSITAILDFEKVDYWPGPYKIGLDAGDAFTEYILTKYGEFSASGEGGTDADTVQIRNRGHVYHAGDVIWLRQGKYKEADVLIQNGNKLCWAIEPDQCIELLGGLKP